jgi:hypothetical protein
VPEKIQRRATINAIAVQPGHMLLMRIIPEIYPTIPAIPVRMARRPKAQVSLFTLSISATFLDTLTGLKGGGVIITYLS